MRDLRLGGGLEYGGDSGPSFSRSLHVEDVGMMSREMELLSHPCTNWSCATRVA
jgi:hypothetical protein